MVRDGGPWRGSPKRSEVRPGASLTDCGLPHRVALESFARKGGAICWLG